MHFIERKKCIFSLQCHYEFTKVCSKEIMPHQFWRWRPISTPTNYNTSMRQQASLTNPKCLHLPPTILMMLYITTHINHIYVYVRILCV